LATVLVVVLVVVILSGMVSMCVLGFAALSAARDFSTGCRRKNRNVTRLAPKK
jgi:hypothetical protein